MFGTEYIHETNGPRKLRLLSNTFCSAGLFFADGTRANIAGAEAGPSGVSQDLNKTRTYAPQTYAPGPYSGSCTHHWIEKSAVLQHTRWYPSAQTLVNGSVLVVGGSDVGGLALMKPASTCRHMR